MTDYGNSLVQNPTSSAVDRRLNKPQATLVNPFDQSANTGSPVTQSSVIPGSPAVPFGGPEESAPQRPVFKLPGGLESTQVGGSAATNPLAGGTGDSGLDQFLGTDTTYQGQLSDLMRQLDQYNSQRNLTASQTQADYDAKQRALGDQSTKDQLQMKNTAAAHGILQSGIYANQLGQYNQDNQSQVTNLLGGLQNTKDNAQMSYNQFIANELAAKQNAIQQAAARRAAKLGVIQ